MGNIDSKPPDQIRYQPVRGLWSTGTLSRASLFTGGDHLLLCDYRSGFTERYKRFYFSDIQAIIIRRTAHWMAGIAIWAFFGLCSLVIALSTHWNLFLEVMVGICALFALRHLIRGPSCRTHIQTAVQTDVLPMLKRVRKTNRILGRLFPLIEQAQGKLGESAAVAQVSPPADPFPAPTIGESKPIARATVAETPVVVRHELSWLHLFTFGLVLLSGLNAIWEVNHPSTISFAILIGLFGASVVSGIVALVRQARHRVHRWAAAAIWVLVITFILGGGGIDYAFSMISLVNSAKAQPHSQPPVMMNFVTPFEMRNMAGFDQVLWIYGGWAILLALLGLISALMPPPVKVGPPPIPGEARP